MKLGKMCKMLSQNAVICKSYKPLFYSKQNTENILKLMTMTHLKKLGWRQQKQEM